MREDRVVDAAPEDAPEGPAPRRTLAMRMAERSRLRAERAERLARLTPAPAPAPAPVAPLPVSSRVPPITSERDAAAALEEFLRSLTQGLGREATPAPIPAPAAGEVVAFQRPAEPAPRAVAPEQVGPAPGPDPSPAASDLERLEGVGPGLLWALRRAGIAALADLASLEPEGLAARLGPLGRLVPARAWIATARGEA